MQSDMAERGIGFILGFEFEVRRATSIDDVLCKSITSVIAMQQGVLVDGFCHHVERLESFVHLRDIAAIANRQG
jgi:hypothetical protein